MMAAKILFDRVDVEDLMVPGKTYSTNELVEMLHAATGTHRERARLKIRTSELAGCIEFTGNGENLVKMWRKP